MFAHHVRPIVKNVLDQINVIYALKDTKWTCKRVFALLDNIKNKMKVYASQHVQLDILEAM